MKSVCDMKRFILKKTKEYLSQLPQDVYVLHFFIHVNEENSNLPTLALMYNSLSEIGESGIEPTEDCWNIACWSTDEFPIISNNFKDTEESLETSKMLLDWLLANGYDYTKIEKDPLDDYYEYTVGYRVLSEIIQEIASDVKDAVKEVLGRDVVLLLGDYSYIPSDVKRILAMNESEVTPFMEYYENALIDTDANNSPLSKAYLDIDTKENYDFCEDLKKEMIEFFEKLKIQYSSEEDKVEILSKAIKEFKNQ